jgi:hypothetical protein
MEQHVTYGCIPCIPAVVLQQENDTEIISGVLGYASAVAGDSQATATPLSTGDSGSGTTTGTGSGLVIKPGVANFFNFSAAAGAASITGKVRSNASSSC